MATYGREVLFTALTIDGNHTLPLLASFLAHLHAAGGRVPLLLGNATSCAAAAQGGMPCFVDAAFNATVSPRRVGDATFAVYYKVPRGLLLACRLTSGPAGLRALWLRSVCLQFLIH